MMDQEILYERVEELIEIERQILELEKKYSRINNIIIDEFDPGEVIEVDDGEVRCRQRRSTKYLDRETTLAYVEEKYGTDVALDIDAQCSMIKEHEKRLHVRWIDS